MLELFKNLLGLTLVDPKAAARKVIDLNLPAAVHLQITGLMIVLAAALSAMFSAPVDAADQTFMNVLVQNPAITAGLEMVVFVLVVFALWRAGRAFGGTGSFDEVLAVTTWNQVISLVIQVLLIIVIVFLPALVPLLVVSLQVAQAFDNVFVTAGVILLSLMGVLMVAGLAAMVFGFYPQGAMS